MSQVDSSPDKNDVHQNLLIRNLIRLDGLAGLAAGVWALLMAGWLASLYGLPVWIIVFNGVVNLAYGTFSSTLATLRHRPMTLVVALSVANCGWAVLCFVVLFFLPSSATVFAHSHAVFEGLFVGVLGILEWRYRRWLV